MSGTLSLRRRALSLLLALSLTLGLLPGSALAAEETPAHWADGYLSQMVEWGFIRADQAKNPDRRLTRADFMSIVNRAYGYKEVGPTPFEDVDQYDWFYDDVGIAYTARYINGTSPTTVSPNDTLNRETAATILGRNMMLQESAGEILDFTDARDISNWARGTIKSSMEHYLVSGYEDGSFRPQQAMTWGEIAALVTRTIGTPLQDKGEYSLGGVFGNVTVTAPGVILRDTVISGDLYITGGVGLGGIKLENVTVLGRIIASGTGTSEGGASILMRNVTADELLVDNLQDKEVSIRADGITEIGRTTVRSSAYIEDNTPDGLGLHLISFEGDFYGEDEEIPEGWTPPRLTLAGRVEEVINKTPDSTVHAAKGTVAKLTVDETAVGSDVVIDRGAVIKELILDTGVSVTGEGDITHLEVNAPGSNVAMLPDEIVIRPGITAVIAGEEMDSATADEFLLDPLILSGYPRTQDVAPTSLEAVFSTNKRGRIYWAVSAITDGSIGADDLIKPPSYGNIAVRWGTTDSPRGNEETIAKITGLQPDGSYYLSAVLEDQKGQLSPVKVISFTTPDNTVPAFNTGYPHMSKVSRTDSVVVVSPNKDCKLYYALLPQGATAPTENELKTSSVSGALGYGVQDVSKNVESTFRVNDVILDEQATYVLYLWLVDANGANKSAITNLTFTTDDETPPEFIVDPNVNQVQATSVRLTFRLNENGTVYWVAVPAGTVYPKPEPGTDFEFAPQNSMYGKLQIATGMNIGTDGKAGQVAARENADGTITVSGLKPEAAYDFYYVAKDNAGTDRNYSEIWKKITINTLDTNGPKVSQSFSRTSGTDKTIDPMSTTDIYLDFSEDVRYTGAQGGKSFLELYQDVKNSNKSAAAVNLLAANLFGAIKLHKISIQDNSEETVFEKHSVNTEFTEDMSIDYTQATVEARSTGGIRVTFPNSGLHLENGGQYYFTIGEITDISNNQNEISPDPVDFWNNETTSKANGHNVPSFLVEFAAVNLSSPGVGAGDGPLEREANGSMKTQTEDGVTDFVSTRIDMSFRMTPTSTSTVSNTISYDVLLWSDSIVTYKLYYRVLDETGKPIHTANAANGTGSYGDFTPSGSDTALKASDYLLPQQRGARGSAQADKNGWIYLGESGEVNPSTGSWSGKSVNGWFNNCGSTSFPKLENLSERLRYEFVITLETYKGSDKYSTWNGEVKFHVNVAAGQSNNLDNLAGQLTTTNWDRFKNLGMSGGARSIGRWNNTQNQLVDTQELSRFFTDSSLPKFMNNAPSFSGITATSVTMNLALETPGTVYYVIGKASNGETGLPEITTTRYILTEDTDAEDEGEGTITHVGSNQMYVTMDSPHAPTDHGTSSDQDMPNWMKGTGNVPPTTGNEPDDDTHDDPGKANLLLAPTSLNIFSPESWSSGVNAIKGRVRSEAFRAEPEIVEGLEPNTDYFAYFVIKGEADDLSHVYVYHFKTDKSAKPKINLRPQTNGSIDLWTDISATMVYALFTKAEAWEIEILAQPFTAAAGTVDSNGDFFDSGLELPDYWSADGKWTMPSDNRPDDVKKNGFTVLDALMTTYSNAAATQSTNAKGNNATAYIPLGPNNNVSRYEEGYSVFDIYASTDIRQKVDELIRTFNNSSTKVPIDYGSNIPSPGGGDSKKINIINTDKLEPEVYYVILTAGQSTILGADDDKLDYLRDSFKANEEVLQTAGDAPNLDNAEGMFIRKNADGTFYISTQLFFDKKIYNTEREAITANTFKDFINSSPPGAEPTVTTISSNKAASGFTLSCDNLEAGSSLTIYEGSICNAGGTPAKMNLTITIDVKKRVEGTIEITEAILTVKWGQERDAKYKYFPYTKELERRDLTTPTTPGGTTGASVNEIKPTGISVKSVSGASLVGTSMKMSGTAMASTVEATVSPEGVTDTVTWASSNPNIVSVTRTSSRRATVKGLAAGTATITAVVGSKSTKFTVTVEPDLSIVSFTPGASSGTITSTGSNAYKWDRTSSGESSAILTFESSVPIASLSDVDVSIKKGSTTNANIFYRTGVQQVAGSNQKFTIQLFSQQGTETDTITITVGGVSQTITVELTGGGVLGNISGNN